MGSEVMEKVPIIDFRKLELKPGSEEWKSVRDKVYQAVEEYGIFEAILDVPTENLYEKIKQVFSFPLATKFENSKELTGYTRDLPTMPLWERMVFLQILNPGVIENFSNLLWPDGNPEFCDLVLSYTKRIREFDEMVRRMIFEKLGMMEKYWEEHTDSISCALSFFKYRVPKAEETTVGLPPHTDKNISTILSQHHVNGLQLKTRNDNWVDVEYSTTNSFLFIVNDCLKALSNGRLYAPYHRVIMGNQERYSMGFCTTPKEGYIIKVAEELVDEDHPLLYKPFDAFKFVEFCISAKTKGVAPTLENFCGV